MYNRAILPGCMTTRMADLTDTTLGTRLIFFFFLSFNRRIASYKVDKVEWVDSADGSVVWMIIGVVSIRGLSYGP